MCLLFEGVLMVVVVVVLLSDKKEWMVGGVENGEGVLNVQVPLKDKENKVVDENEVVALALEDSRGWCAVWLRNVMAEGVRR